MGDLVYETTEMLPDRKISFYIYIALLSEL
jgi:hypothetical protein